MLKPFMLIIFLCVQICFHVEPLAAEAVIRQEHPNIYKEESLVFVILTRVENESQNYLWRRCYESVRRFYPDTLIVIIDNNSVFPISNENLTNTAIVHSEYEAGELMPYYYFVKYKWADKMVFLHDSMLLKRQFTKDELRAPIKFHWKFDVHWFDDDQMINQFLSQLQHGDELIEFNLLKQWHGCFGVASTIALDLLEEIESKYAFTASLVNAIRSRSQRMALERILGILMFKEKYVTYANCSNYGIIHYFPGAFLPVSDEQLHDLIVNYPGAIIKTWVGR